MALDLGGVIERSTTDTWDNSYDSISGVDIKAVFNGQAFGNLQAISYSITREKVI